jgi:exonuclease SbcD
MTEALENEVVVLYDDKRPEAIVCAVPYLRDKDIRTVEPGETIDDKNTKLAEGLKQHYIAVCRIAENKREEFNNSGYTGIPIIGMGHLFTAGGKTVEGDGVRELYVGSLAHVGKEVFPSSMDYLALGHLHVPQVVGGAEHIRYSGSPIPMGYGEATQEKKVVLIDFNSTTPHIQELPVRCFQKLVRIEGSLDDIHAKLEELKKEESSAWLEIEYTGSDIISNLREMLDEAMADSDMEIRRIKNRHVMDRVISTGAEDETLDDLDTGDVFTRCLDAFEVPDEDREGLTVSYNEIIKSLHEEDVNAE